MNSRESEVTIRLLGQFRGLGLEKPYLEHEFDPSRKYRADFAFKKKKILVEIEGWGHVTAGRFAADLHKYNSAASLGWRLIRLTPAMVMSGESITILQAAFYPTPVFMERCMKCLGLNENNESIHQECFEILLNEGELDNEQVREHRRTRKSPLHRARQIEASY
jgi:hypothetical protein